MKKIFLFTLCCRIVTNAFAQQKNNVQQDREAILSFAGCYKVVFEFAETFAPDTAYQYHDRKFDWGIEQVSVLENTNKKIVLQHLLIVNDTMIIKHWRQDWVYENTELLSYYKDNEWIKVKLTATQAKGTWTQKVFQVDDSPRYEGYGTWIHVDGRHFWESTTDAPLPRREITKRQDYNVVKRHSHVETMDYGWVLEQDNEKIIRSENGDKLLCWEKGMEKFLKGNYNCKPGLDWWTRNSRYWNDVRTVWDEVFSQQTVLKLEKRIEDKFLFEKLFALGDEYAKKETYNSNEAKANIKKTIALYLKK
ncbi:MAG: hypothetical protein JWO58_141 [Chitinophagaceae bacterium]|nr:hypothetical protein [Chitinophagaceae bacterium]